MKPTEPDIEYCIEHKEFINGLLEKSGGLEEGDKYTRSNITRRDRWWLAAGHGRIEKFGYVVWLPSVGDVLGMLEEALAPLGEGDYGWALEGAVDADRYQAWIPEYRDEGTGLVDEDICATEWLPTPLIALLELLRTVEDV